MPSWQLMLPECPIAAIGNVLDAPATGHFAIRLGSRHPWTPALIFLPCPMLEADPFDVDALPPEDWCTPLDRAPYPLRAMVGERVIEDMRMILCLWQGARAVTVAEYNYLMARRAWARHYEPQSYHAQPVNLAVLKNRDLL
jgi:hypothetical protein